MDQNQSSFEQFSAIMDILLGENGCPWDKAQTHETLLHPLVEETYEVVDVIKKGDMDGLCEELGDLLLQVVIHAKIAEKLGHFTLDDVCMGIAAKMKHRHPHVFGDTVVSGTGQVLDNWERIKRDEKGFASHTAALRSVPDAMPALLKAAKVQDKAQKSGVLPTEETALGLEALKKAASQKISKLGTEGSDFVVELGELLFAVVTISRKLQVIPEFALTNAVEQFINRFECVENNAENI